MAQNYKFIRAISYETSLLNPEKDHPRFKLESFGFAAGVKTALLYRLSFLEK
jgi:hypothetical protein